MFLKIPQNLMLSCEFCENFKNTFFTEHFQKTTSENITLLFITLVILMQKILSFIKIWQCPVYKCCGDQLSSRKYEELLGMLIDHKCTFEDQLLNIAQKINQEYQSTCLKRSWQFAYYSLIWIIHNRQINHNKFHERVT